MGILSLFGKMVQAEEFIDRLTPKVSLETFMESLSEQIDGEIRRAEQEENLYFLGGKMHFTLSPDGRELLMNAEIFYQTAGGGYQKAEKFGKYMVSMLKQDAYEDFLEKIVEMGEVVMEINEP